MTDQRNEGYALPEGMTAEKLRTVADWLDTYDKLALRYFDILEKNQVIADPDLLRVVRIARSTEVQDDLRLWADAIEVQSHNDAPTPVEGDVMDPPLADHGFAWIGQSWSTCENCGRPAVEHPGMELLRHGTSPFDLSDEATEMVPWEEAAKRVPLAGAYGLLQAVHTAPLSGAGS